METTFSDYMNDAVRILILLDAVKERKSIKMTDNKIKLYDYYLKFPYVMLSDIELEIDTQQNFDEYYAFFHWQPDLIRYKKSIHFLLSKGLITREVEKNAIVFKITELGVNALDNIENPYKNRLVSLTKAFITQVVKLSDLKIGQLIHEKSRMFYENGVGKNDG